MAIGPVIMNTWIFSKILAKGIAPNWRVQIDWFENVAYPLFEASMAKVYSHSLGTPRLHKHTHAGGIDMIIVNILYNKIIHDKWCRGIGT